MAVAVRLSKLTSHEPPAARLTGKAAEPVQLSLHFSPPKPNRASAAKPSNGKARNALPDVRLAAMDQRLSTRDVVLVVGVNRSTIFRWTKSGRFPQKHKSGGWLRSDVERWLAEHAGDADFSE